MAKSNTLAQRTIEVFGHQMNVEFVIDGSGQIVKLFAQINGKQWTSWNLCNFKRNQNESFDQIKEMLMDGSFKMFV